MNPKEKFTLAGAAEEVRRKAGVGVHPSTVSRWATDGITLTDGTLVKLARVRVLGRVFIERRAVWDFLAAIQEVPA